MDERTFPSFPALSARTLAASALGAGEPATRALTPPIHVATTYVRDEDSSYRTGFVYGRSDNLSIHQAEAVIAGLEHAGEAMMFSSGTAAATAVFLSLAPTRIVAPKVMYWGLRQWLRDLPRYGHEVTFVDMSDLDAVHAAIVPCKTGLRTGLVWIETPSNPLWTITDIRAVAACAHQAGAIVCVDSTVPTPILTRPLDCGADLVVHSATKYLNGHSDVVAGVIATARKDAAWARIRDVRQRLGAVLGPFDAFLLMRGLRTVDLRVRAQCRTAALLAERLQVHPAVKTVLYPGLIDHPGHAIAARQMHGGFGGMLSFRLRDRAEAIAVAARVRLWRRATSFGGVESLIEHRASIEGAGSPCPDDLLRLSAGLEDPDDLYADLLQALSAVTVSARS
jgi:cystathionine gamma-synthase